MGVEELRLQQTTKAERAQYMKEVGEKNSDRAYHYVEIVYLNIGGVAADYIWSGEEALKESEAIWWHTIQWALFPDRRAQP